MISQSYETLKNLSLTSQPVNIFLSRKAWHQDRNILGKIYKLFPHRLHDALSLIETYLSVHFPNLVTKWISYRLRQDKALADLSKEYIAVMNSSDAVISSGGGFITDAFEDHAISILEMLYLAHHLGKPTALFGQGIGPVRSPRLLKVMQRVLPTIDLITLREKKSGLQLLLELGVSKEKVIVTGDDAIELASIERSYIQGENIGFNIRVAEYASVNSQQDLLVAEIIKSFSNQKNSRISSIPISWYPKEHDLNQINKLFDCGTPTDEVLNHFNIDELVKRIAQCPIVIMGSYHAGVFALAQGIPIIGLARSKYYVDKFNGLSDMFSSGVKVISFDDETWQDKLLDALNKSWDDAEILRPNLIKQADEQIALSQNAYANFFLKNKLI